MMTRAVHTRATWLHFLMQCSLVVAGAVASAASSFLDQLLDDGLGGGREYVKLHRAATDASAHAVIGCCAYISFLLASETKRPTTRDLFAALALAIVASVLLDCDRFIEVGAIRLDASSVLGRQGFMHCVTYVICSAIVAHAATVAVVKVTPCHSACCRPNSPHAQADRESENIDDSVSAAPTARARVLVDASEPRLLTATARLSPASRHWRMREGVGAIFWLVLVTGLAHTLRDAERRGWWLTPQFLGSVRTPKLPWLVAHVAQILVGGVCGLIRAWLKTPLL